MSRLPNGCELPVLGPQAQVSGPALMINEEARPPSNELPVELAHDAGSAPASC
jgi:hypothetical protein